MQVHKDQVQEMRRRHLAGTIDLQYQQLHSLHEMRTDHLNKQHALEWDNQLAYGRKADRELKKKHVLELKEHPKSLRVRQLMTLKVCVMCARRVEEYTTVLRQLILFVRIKHECNILCTYCLGK